MDAKPQPTGMANTTLHTFYVPQGHWNCTLDPCLPQTLGPHLHASAHAVPSARRAFLPYTQALGSGPGELFLIHRVTRLESLLTHFCTRVWLAQCFKYQRFYIKIQIFRSAQKMATLHLHSTWQQAAVHRPAGGAVSLESMAAPPCHVTLQRPPSPSTNV